MCKILSASCRPPLLASELLEHPEFGSLFWDLKPARKGSVTVAEGRRGGPLRLTYEIHGEGAIKLVVGLMYITLNIEFTSNFPFAINSS